VEAGRSYDDYGPAYATGWTERERYDADFAKAEPELAAGWEARRGSSTLSWDEARPAARQSWDRVNTRYFNADEAVDTEPMAHDEVVDVLNDLLENCRDGEYGFRACAEEVQSLPAKQLFDRRAAGCRAAEAELLPLIAAYGGKPAEGGTAGGALHRGWVHVKGSLGADSELTILESCERGEDTAIARYRKALKHALPPEVREVVQRQAEGAQRNHDEIRAARPSARRATRPAARNRPLRAAPGAACPTAPVPSAPRAWTGSAAQSRAASRRPPGRRPRPARRGKPARPPAMPVPA